MTYKLLVTTCLSGHGTTLAGVSVSVSVHTLIESFESREAADMAAAAINSANSRESLELFNRTALKLYSPSEL